MTRTAPRLLAALTAVALLCGLLAAAASAEPRLELQMTRTDQPIHVGDERLAYKLEVKNEASPNPQVGDTLTCNGVGGASGNPPADVVISWLRSGVTIAGASEETYVVTAADAGESIQCQVTRTNDPGDVLPGPYAPIAAVSVSLPPVTIEPVPASAPPSGSAGPGMAGPLLAAVPSGTATITTGSKILTDVVSAAGSGTFTSGSPVVEGVTMSTGERFEAQQAVAGSCVAAGSRIFKVEETAAGIFRVTLDQAASCSGPGTLEAGAQPFGLLQDISGECIPAGAKIIRATNQGVPGEPTVRFIEMDVAATCSKTDVAITAKSILVCTEPTGWSAGSTIAWSYQWLRNGIEIAGETDPEYKVLPGDTSPPSILQCRATAEDAEGNRAVAVSFAKSTSPAPPSPYAFPSASSLSVGFENETSGEVALELEAPAGAETHVFGAVGLGSGWDCARTAPAPPLHASVRCTRSDPLPPQNSYPAVEVVIALGKNPPSTLVTKAEVSGGGSDPMSVLDEYTIPEPRVPFGFEAFEVEVLDELGGDYTQAGGHPFSAGASLKFNWHETPAGGEALAGPTREVRTQTPPGFTGNPLAVEELCPSIADVVAPIPSCPLASVVGAITVVASGGSGATDFPIYALEPETGVPAQFAFKIGEFAYTLSADLRPEQAYAVDVVTQPLAKWPEVFASEVTLCGFGAIVETNAQGVPIVKGCRAAADPEATEMPFLTNPTRCAGKPVTRILADSWEGQSDEAVFESPPLTGCEKVPFEPSITLAPTSNRADSPTGMDVELRMPTNGLEGKDEEGNRDPEAIAQANLEGTTVTLPEGMAVNPSSASGLGACSLEQLGMSAAGVPNKAPVACPEPSKLGTLEAETPLLDHPLGGTVYLARQGSNPFGSLLALYLVIDSPEDGILIKLAGRVSPDPVTGRLTVSFDGNPQAPLSRVSLHFAGGNRAALINPPQCGTYAIETQLTPWTAADPAQPTEAETVEISSPFEVTQGPGGGPCPSGALEPSFSAGLDGNQAGATSPFRLRLSRNDGTQRFRQITATTPPGLSAYLKGIPYCPDSVLAAIPTAPGTGAAQLAAPACPAASRVGTVTTGAGAGPDPLFIDTGKAYLAGPYKGAPLSLAVAAPAVAGPFDLGNVVVRTALRLNPESAQITALSDPIPTILQGIPLDVREIRIALDRPHFTLAPTSCEPMAVSATVSGEKGATASVSDRFQVGGCEKLAFKPDLKLRLKGSTKRGAYQRLTATLTARAGDANISRASVALPHSIFLAQEHIGTVCTRVQFAADQCPQGSVYGKATATSPLLDYPLQGTVYLRSSSNPLPDMVVAFRGPPRQPIEIDLVGRIDSKHGGIRTSFEAAPDAPVSKFTLRMRGGKRSLLVNSRELCRGTQRASVRMSAHNGRRRDFRAVVENDCKKGKPKPKGKGKR